MTHDEIVATGLHECASDCPPMTAPRPAPSAASQPDPTLAERMPCVPEQRHVFLADSLTCLCGVVTRASVTEHPEAFALWPTPAPQPEPLRAAAARNLWSFKKGTLRERLEWARVQHELAAERPLPAEPASHEFHRAAAVWYAQMVSDLDDTWAAARDQASVVQPQLLQEVLEAGDNVIPVAGEPDPGPADWSRFSAATHAIRRYLADIAAPPEPSGMWAAIEEELAIAEAAGDDASQFEMGASAAYHFVLSFLTAAPSEKPEP